jgi:hypothetical protein
MVEANATIVQIVAVKSGTVKYVKTDGTTYTTPAGYNCVSYKQKYANDANFVVVEHEDGNQSVYLHFNDGSITVKPGDFVHQGQILGNIGNSGWSCGTHLHFQVQRSGTSWFEQSISISFDDVTPNNGVPQENSTYISGNNGDSAINAVPSGTRNTGNISITGQGFGTTQSSGHVSVTVDKMAKSSIVPTTFNAAITSWSDKEIQANIFQGVLNSTNFDFPVTITAYKSDGTKVGDVSYPFKDVKSSDTFACAIQQLWKKPSSNGYVVNGKNGSGDFVPREKNMNCTGNCPGFVSRAEFLSMAYAANSKLPTPYSSPLSGAFPDVTSDKWYAKYVAVAKDNGVTSGNETSRATKMACVDPLNPWGSMFSGLKCFWPDDPITRYEAAAILTALYRIPYKNGSSDYWTYKDATLKDWNDFMLGKDIAPFIARSHKGNNGCTIDSVPVMKGNETGYFRPDDPISREEAAGIISLAINAVPAK